MRLEGQLVSAAAISPAQREQMFRLMDRYYENVTIATFVADLAEKQWVILLHERGKEALCGFSTQALLECQADGRRIKALFSGDTVIDQAHRGDIALAHIWGHLAMMLMEQCAGEELYWFLITKGYKTYRYLPLFFREFYPRHDRPTPARVRCLIDALGQQKFGPAYDAAAGVIRAHPGNPRKDRLRPGVAEITAERLRDPHVRFFAQRNPGWVHGEELCCIAPLTDANWTAAARRALTAGSITTGG